LQDVRPRADPSKTADFASVCGDVENALAKFSTPGPFKAEHAQCVPSNGICSCRASSIFTLSGTGSYHTEGKLIVVDNGSEGSPYCVRGQTAWWSDGFLNLEMVRAGGSTEQGKIDGGA
jgi:hypothetical protein